MGDGCILVLYGRENYNGKPETGTGAEDDGRRKHRLARSRRTAGQNRERGFAMNRILIIDDDRELCVLNQTQRIIRKYRSRFLQHRKGRSFEIEGKGVPAGDTGCNDAGHGRL